MKWITILFALFIIFIIVLADLGMLDVLSFANRIPYGDKIGHFVLYGILTLLLDLTLFRALPTRRPNWIAFFVGLVLALAIGLEEYSQKFFASRTFSLADLAASHLGVIFFSWVALIRTVGRD
jgi:VanZ family protein